MLELFQMWALVEVLGLICLPLTVTVFHNLPDRGWAFTKAIGMAMLAFLVWLPLMILRFLPFSQFFILGVLLILLAFNLIGFLRMRQTIVNVVRTNLFYIIVTELVFFAMMLLLGWIRSFVPDIRINEMFMDEGFIAAIMRSPHFPPSDMWYSGFPINYYYYAQYVIAVLAKLLGQSPSIAFNTGICTFFGLTAVNLFGVTCNIVSWARYRRGQQRNAPEEPAETVYPPLWRSMPYGFLTFIMGLVLGNLAATQQWWDAHGDWALFNWYSPSRVIDKTINEFPAFSFLLSCFHAHVLTLAFTILAIGLAFNLFLAYTGERGPNGRGSKGLFVFGHGWQLPLTMGVTAIILGGLFTMNGWDFPTYVGLAIICIALQQWLAYGSRFCLELVLDVFTACAGLVALSFVLYAPFYLGFISPSQGIGIVGPADRSPLGGEILIYGLFAFVFLSLLIANAFKHPFFASVMGTETGNIDDGSRVIGGEPAVITDLHPPVTHTETEVEPAVAVMAVAKAEESRATPQVAHPMTKQRPWLNGGLISVVSIFVVALLLWRIIPNSTTFVVAGSIAAFATVAILRGLHDRPQSFTLLLGGIAFGLVAITELFFLKDVFADSVPRMNTVFKFYFQAWALLAITSGAGLYFILDSFRPTGIIERSQRLMQRGVESLWGLGLILLLLASAVYPLGGAYTRTNYYTHRSNSLDGFAYMQNCNIPNCDYDTSGDYYAIKWLNSNVSGNPVIVEAVGDDYSSYARISAFTGLPTPMGWVGHEYQWRVNWLNNGLNAVDFNSRKTDVDTIYTDPHPDVVLNLLARYHVQYVYVGLLEQMKYPSADLHRFASFMNVVYSAHGVTIYEVK
ncbi:MAG TPA: DUF2298 domain-containing protein [Ktedonobacteraceae bacterium]|nr:DUF2298 domain-containing protein [Ktedonobacteraceae bacterium]